MNTEYKKIQPFIMPLNKGRLKSTTGILGVLYTRSYYPQLDKYPFDETTHNEPEKKSVVVQTETRIQKSVGIQCNLDDYDVEWVVINDEK